MVIPTYNERENIVKLIPRLQDVLSSTGYENSIIIVDDDSPDGTYHNVEYFCKNLTNVFLIKRYRKGGLGSACRDGFLFAVDKLNADVVISMDADFSHDPKCIPNFLKKLNEGYDIVVGSRYILGGRIKNWSNFRILVSRVANMLAHQLLRIKINDVTSNYRAYRSRVIKIMDFFKIKSKGFSFLPEFLYNCRRKGFKIGEIPITYVERRHGKSKLDVAGIVNFLKMVFRLAFTRNYDIK